MLEMKECCTVPYPEKLFEEYEISDNAIHANVNTSKVLAMMERFIEYHDERFFFILEVPAREDDGMTESKILYKAYDDRDVYFIDGLTGQQAVSCLNAIGGFLLKDGMNTFGIGGHESHEEILFGQYNVMTIYTKNAERYQDFFDLFGIKQTDDLVTAWQTFDEDHAGECRLYVSDTTGKTIYDIPESYKEYGMYLYETRRGAEQAAEKEVKMEDLLGKLLLVGVTYFTHDNVFIEKKQFYGTVTEANDTIIRIKQKDGSEFTLPPDLRTTGRAAKGEYKLHSTGEIVVDPDYIAVWTCIKAEEGR